MNRMIQAGLIVAHLVLAGNLVAASFGDLSVEQMETVLGDALLSRGVYDDNAELQEGCSANGDFLNSSMVNKGFTTTDGRTVFRFNSGNAELDSYLYSYNPDNGMITPYDGDPYRDFMSGIFPEDYTGSPKPPDFAAQVTVKDGVTQIAFRGTQTASDWWENANQFWGNVPPQYELADCLVQAAQETSSRPVHVTGHSEGGGESQYVVLRSIERGRNDITGTGFNSQRLSEEVLGLFSQETRDMAGQVMTQYRVENDVVSGWEYLGENLIGTTYELDPVCWVGDYFCFAPLTAHEMDTVIARIAAEIAAKQENGGVGGPNPDDSPAPAPAPAPAPDDSSPTVNDGSSRDDSEESKDDNPGDPFDSSPENDGSQPSQPNPVSDGGTPSSPTPQPTPSRRGGSGGGDTRARLW